MLVLTNIFKNEKIRRIIRNFGYVFCYIYRLTGVHHLCIIGSMEKSYDAYKQEAIDAFSQIYKDSLAFDLAGVPRDLRLKLLEDEEYISKTKQIKANLYASQLKIINSVIKGEHSDPDKGDASEILKAIEMRNKLLFNDLNIDADESSAVNIVMIEMSRDDFMKMETVEVFIENTPQSDTVSIDIEVDS